ncbi:MAG: tetratricopeptide repeat protein [Firmicutes bacterium]|nr:tetratricopeptide repeat protein [Bacillota bacterium]
MAARYIISKDDTVMTPRGLEASPRTLGLLQALVFLLPLCFSPWNFDVFELPKILLLRAMIFLVLAAKMFAGHKECSLPRLHLHWPVLTLLGVNTIATLTSVAPYISLTGAGGLLALMDGIAIYFVTARTLVTGVNTTDNSRRLLRAAVLSGVLLSAYGLAQHFGWDFGSWDLSEQAGTSALRYRSFSTLGSPSFLGLYLAMVLPLSLLNPPDQERFWPFVKWGIAILLPSICLVFTYSRAAWLGVGFGVSLFLLSMFRKSLADANGPPPNQTGSSTWAKSRQWLGYMIMASGLLLGGLLAPLGNRPTATARVVSLVDLSGGSVQVRLKLWRGAWRMFLARPLLGWGPSTFRYIFPRYAPPGMTETERRNISAHNCILDCLVQTGILGLAVYIWLGIAVIRQLHYEIDKEDRWIRVAIGASLGAYLTALQFGFSAVASTNLAWLLLGCLASEDGRARRLHPPRWLQKILPIGLIITWMILTTWTARWFIADLCFRAGQDAWAKGRRDLAAERLTYALTWHPRHDFYWARLGQLREEDLRGSGGYCFQKAISINPLNAANHALLAVALQETGRLSAARIAWQKTVELDPWWHQAHNALGVLYHRLGENEKARQSYQTALKINPDYAEALNNLGNLYLEQGKIEDAINCYQQALILKPGWEMAERNLHLARNRLKPRTSKSK